MSEEAINLGACVSNVVCHNRAQQRSVICDPRLVSHLFVARDNLNLQAESIVALDEIRVHSA